MPKITIGLAEALRMTLDNIEPLQSENVALFDAVDRVAAESLCASVDSPSVDASLKDGYAIRASELASASEESPVSLRLAGSAAAGGHEDLFVNPGSAVRILTGAKMPLGADAVIPDEYANPQGEHVLVSAQTHAGRNILPRGSDVAIGSCIVEPGQRLSPGLVGLLAAAGSSEVAVVRRPRVCIVATGDEVVAPGQPLAEGKLYASNLTTLGSWCRRYHMDVQLAIVRDDADEIAHALKSMLDESDALVTSGGAWTGDRDLVAHVLGVLGWNPMFHRIRIGPGKAVGFGILDGKPVFVLPGGPPSNLMGFVQIALPGLLRLAGHKQAELPTTTVRLTSDLIGAHDDWTQFIFGTLHTSADVPEFDQLSMSSRLQSMADAQAVVAIPEGHTRLAAGTLVSAQLLS